jgi:hypothetical protein
VPTAPGDEYRSRLADRRALHATLNALDARLSAVRLATFGSGVALAIAGWVGALSWWWLAAPVLAFAVLIQRHDRVIRQRDAAARAIAFYERGLARIEDRWIGGGEPGDRFRDDTHLFANDVDLFGRGSLFELLSIARTRAGEETLAGWLKRPAAPDDVRARQEAVTELTPSLDLREALALAGTDVRAGVDSDALVAWAQEPPHLHYPWLRHVGWVLTAAALASAAWWIISTDPAFFIAVVALEIVYSVPQRKAIQRALHAAEGPARDLDVLAHVLERIERDTFTAARLAALRGSLDTGHVPASTAISRLHRLVELHDWQHNQFFAPIAAAMLWGTHLAWAIEAWRARYGSHVATWLRTVGEFEALGSLAAYRYEHPDDVWPELVNGAQATFDGLALGHPLLPAARMVRNDVRLAGHTRLLVVSGSNMSGKSTLLRTVGINTVLALAGAPVRASSLLLTPLACGATLRIQDSLQEGRSRFFAEITRIRELTDVASGPTPLLFLLDELFHGTNSHDRLVGASAVLRTLVDRGAIGLITTHDLALTAVVTELAPHAENVHFDDHFSGGEIVFDYRMKPGPVTRSNAIALMRAVGLDIDIDQDAGHD